MDTKTLLTNAVKEAMKAGDTQRRDTLRMALSAIKQIEVDRRVSLDEAAVQALLQKEIKTRREALAEAQSAARADLAAAAEAEIAILGTFLPKGLSAEELRTLAQNAIAESGAASAADMGKVMKLLMPKVAGRAPGDQVSAQVKDLLS